MRLSARGYHRVLRVARTLANLTGAESVGRAHLADGCRKPSSRAGQPPLEDGASETA